MLSQELYNAEFKLVLQSTGSGMFKATDMISRCHNRIGYLRSKWVFRSSSSRMRFEKGISGIRFHET